MNQTNLAKTITPSQIFEIILRRRWIILIPFLIASIIGCYYAITLPKIYQSSTSILIQPQKVPGDYIKSIVSTDINSRLATISQQILSRSNLEKIIDRFKLNIKSKNSKKIYIEDVVGNLRRKIEIKVTKGKRKAAGSFIINFKGKEPVKVMQVTNALANYFMDENLKIREAQAVGTSDFLEAELEKTRQKLEKQEQILALYNSKHLGSLPEELDTNLRALDRLQEQLSSKQSALLETKGILATLEAKYAFSSETRNDQPDELKLVNAEKELEDLQMKYTKNHPDVIKINTLIKSLKEKIIKKSSDLKKNEKRQPFGVLNELAIQIQEVNFEIKRFQSDIKNIKIKMRSYQKKVEDTPKRELELLSLRRDYSNISDTYNSLLARKLEAEIAVNMEKKQKGEQFRILDYARLPEKPISPDMKKIFLLSIAAGLGLGGGIIFLLEFIDTSFRREEDIESFLGLPVLATIPLIKKPRDHFKKIVNNFLTVIALLISGFFVGLLALFSVKGVDQAMDFVGKYINL